ncbi:MAG: cache domain-containing protein [Candidatus Omnitrophica bacterium]|nr:cache domain-containing protein [Candidatus Omnitrophota bacterium]
MRPKTLRTQIVGAFIAIIIFVGTAITLLVYTLLQQELVVRIKNEVRKNLDATRTMYQQELDAIRWTLELLAPPAPLSAERRTELGLDYLAWLTPEQAGGAASEIVREAARQGQARGGSRLIFPEELNQYDAELAARARIAVIPTPRAAAFERRKIDTALALEYAVPVHDAQGDLCGVLAAGKIINRRFVLVDRIRDLIFDYALYRGEALGRVTIFLDDVRVATNVVDGTGNRAIGTRAAAEVYHTVIEQKKQWIGRSLVMQKWYFTAYEPIFDINGRPIGILSLGVLEEPFAAEKNRFMAALFAIIISSIVLASAAAVWIISRITRPVQDLLRATAAIRQGDMCHRIPDHCGVKEFCLLNREFNAMVQKLAEREQGLRQTNEQLGAMNRNYLDVVGFVSHELKSILSSLIVNSYNLGNGLLGALSDAQKKAVQAMSKNLEYLAATVRNFLSLSRIEKNELALHRVRLSVRADIFEEAVDAFAQLAQEKQMRVVNEIPADITVDADRDMMQIVANNLVANAVKYGQTGGTVRLAARRREASVEVDVYNDGIPIAPGDLPKLFRRFSRLHYAGTEKIKGTGIGLFIAQRIIEQHGGSLAALPESSGNVFRFRLNAAD